MSEPSVAKAADAVWLGPTPTAEVLAIFDVAVMLIFVAMVLDAVDGRVRLRLAPLELRALLLHALHALGVVGVHFRSLRRGLGEHGASFGRGDPRPLRQLSHPLLRRSHHADRRQVQRPDERQRDGRVPGGGQNAAPRSRAGFRLRLRLRPHARISSFDARSTPC